MSAGLPSRSALRQWELRFGPNMTPMVDIVMVILIFFMAGTAFVGPEWFLRAALPAARAGPGPGEDPFALPPARFEISLLVDSGRTLATGVGLVGAPLADLERALDDLGREARGTGVIILLRPAAPVPYRDVIRVRDACERAGLTKVGLLEAS